MALGEQRNGPHPLRVMGARPEPNQRVVRSGKIITAAGVSAGIDLALWLAGELAGRVRAEAIQLVIEYDPQPPLMQAKKRKRQNRCSVGESSVGRTHARRPESPGSQDRLASVDRFRPYRTVSWAPPFRSMVLYVRASLRQD